MLLAAGLLVAVFIAWLWVIGKTLITAEDVLQEIAVRGKRRNVSIA